MLKLQYDLFEELNPFDEMLGQIEEVESTLSKVRKGTYASINEVKKMVLEMRDDVELIKRHLCTKEE